MAENMAGLLYKDVKAKKYSLAFTLWRRQEVPV